MSSFSVVALMKEEPVIIKRFIQYYKRLGAENIYIFYDGEIDHLFENGLDLQEMQRQGVEIYSCSDQFWESEFGKVPEHLEHRLRAAFAVGHRYNKSDWLFVCDADEFIIDRIPVADFLSSIPEEVVSVRLRPAEAVWGPGEDIAEPFGSTWFRRPSGRRSRDEILQYFWLYGPFGLLFRQGILSHTQGKQFVRRGVEFDLIHQHHATLDGRKVSVWAEDIDPALGGVELAHFDAISYGRWYQKFLRPILDYDPVAMQERSGRRRLQIRFFKWSMTFGDAGTRWLCRRLYSLTPRQKRWLERRNLAFQEKLFG